MSYTLTKEDGVKGFARGTVLCGLVVVIGGSFTVPRAVGWDLDTFGTVNSSVFVPKGYTTSTKYPLVMILHGAGASFDNTGQYPESYHRDTSEQDVKILSSDTNQAKYPCIVYAPQANFNDHWVNLPGSTRDNGVWDYGTYSIEAVPQSNSLRDALRGLDSVIAKYSVDTNRIYLGGGSMGGYGTWDALCRGYFPKFACAVPVGGAGDTSKARNFKNIPLWAFATTNDGIIPQRFAQQMITAMQNAGGAPRYTWYENDHADVNGYESCCSHLWILPFVIEPELMPWIFAQSKASTQGVYRQRAPVSTTSVQRARAVVNLGRVGVRSVSVRFLDEGWGSSREFTTQGRPVGGRQIGR